VIAFLVSPLGRWAVVAAVLAALSGWAWLERAGRHAANVRAEAAEAQAEAAARAITALEAQAADAAAQAARIEPIRRVIHAAPKTNACADSPAIRAVLDGLRQGAGGDRAR
jgi:type VI protein secretion system component VasK